MRQPIPRHAAFTLVSLALSSGVMAQSAGIDYGRAEYVENCQVCHGPTGKGDGQFGEYLSRPPSDLTVLARNNGGVFPAQSLYEIIDGRKTVAGHGRRSEMPIWGSTYSVRGRHNAEIGPERAEAYARNSINLLIDYLYRIQQK